MSTVRPRSEGTTRSVDVLAERNVMDLALLSFDIGCLDKENKNTVGDLFKTLKKKNMGATILKHSVIR